MVVLRRENTVKPFYSSTEVRSGDGKKTLFISILKFQKKFPFCHSKPRAEIMYIIQLILIYMYESMF